jgi:hypothetical protein
VLLACAVLAPKVWCSTFRVHIACSATLAIAQAIFFVSAASYRLTALLCACHLVNVTYSLLSKAWCCAYGSSGSDGCNVWNANAYRRCVNSTQRSTVPPQWEKSTLVRKLHCFRSFLQMITLIQSSALDCTSSCANDRLPSLKSLYLIKLACATKVKSTTAYANLRTRITA